MKSKTKKRKKKRLNKRKKMFCDEKVSVVFIVNYKLTRTYCIWGSKNGIDVKRRDQIQKHIMPVSTQTIILLNKIPRKKKIPIRG